MFKPAEIIRAVATDLLGDPNPAHSSEPNPRWGSNGSLSVDCTNGVWYDHEAGTGGGVRDLVRRELPGADVDMYLSRFSSLVRKSEKRHSKLKAISKVVESYEYRDCFGDIVFVVDRLQPKSFRQRRPDGNNGWIPTVRGINTSIPYHLPELLGGQTVFIVEGEKDVHALEKLRLTATTSAGGAGKWTAEHAVWLDGKDVIIIPDNDDAGRAHAKHIQGTLPNARILHLEGLPDKGDVSDWIEQGGTAPKLIELAGRDSPPPLHGPMFSFSRIEQMAEQEWLIEGLIPEDSLVVMYGASGVGKTFLCLDMAACIAHGMSYHELTTGEGWVIYVAAEGVRGLRKRSGAWHKDRERNMDDGRFFARPQATMLNSPVELEHLVSDIKQVTSDGVVQLIILDTLGRMFGGDENSAEAMHQAIAGCDFLRETFRCTVMPVHHTGKDASRGARGSSALFGAADTFLKVEDVAGFVTLSVEKQKDDEPMPELVFKRRKIARQAHPLAKEETSLVFDRHRSGSSVPKASRLTNTQRIAFETLGAAINKHGEVVPGIRGLAVKRTVWRDLAVDRDISSGSSDSARKAFDRAAGELQKKRLVDAEKGYCFYLKKEVENKDI